MKRMIAGLAGLAALTGVCAEGNMYGNQAQNEGLFVVPKKAAVTVDGRIDPAEWDLSGQIWSFADWDCREMYSVKTAAMWDREALYLCFDWRDPTPLNSMVDPRDDPSHGWTADAVQLRTSASDHVDWITLWGYKGGTVPCVDVVHSAKGTHPEDRKVEHLHYLTYAKKPGETKLDRGIELAYRPSEDGKGFTQEVKIPWPVIRGEENADFESKPGEKFRMGLEFYWGRSVAKGHAFPLHNYKDNLQPGVYTREFFWRAIKSWGDVTLTDGPVARREYVHKTVRPEGTIPVRVDLPADAEFFTLAIDAKDGSRVRALCGGESVADFEVKGGGAPAGKRRVEVLWDGLDDGGRLVKKGEYVVKALVSGPIDGYFETAFYNPGTPPWGTLDTKGSWGADHSSISTLGRAGDCVICCSDFAEGGYGCFALGPDGRKLWSDKRGSGVVAGNAKYVFIVPNDWSKLGSQILRIEAQTGKYAPFAKDGDMPLGLEKLFGLKAGAVPPRVVGLALNRDGLLMACSDDKIRVIDPETGALLRTFGLHATPVGGHALFVADDTDVYSFYGRELRRTAIDSGKTEFVPLKGGWFDSEPAVAEPRAMALGDDGLLYITDNGPDCQVKVFSKDGRLVRRIGKKGGRNRQGRFDRDGMLAPFGVTTDRDGNVWVAESQDYPRRVSVWTKDGAFLKDYLGNTGYAGHGSMIHRQDPTKGCASFNEISLDPKTGAWDVTNIMFNPDDSKGIVIRPGGTSFHAGDMFYSSASGERREYFSSVGEARNTPYFFMMRGADGNWSSVAAITTVGKIQKLVGGQYGAQVLSVPYGPFAGHDAGDTVIWNDFNNDGYVTFDECEFVPSLTSTAPKGGRTVSIQSGQALQTASNTTTDMDDLGIYVTLRTKEPGKNGKVSMTWGRLLPVSYRDGGKPVYSMKGYRPYANPTFTVAGAATEVPGQDRVVGFISQERKTWIAAWKKSDATVLWRYPSPYHQVHGSHNAPMPRPGLEIGALKVMGVATGCGDSDVFMVRGNLGEDYFFTADGFYVNRFTRDGRLPSLALPDSEETLRKTSYRFLGGRGEHFSGNFARQTDGVIRASGAVPTDQGCSVVRIEGLGTVRHAGERTISVGEPELVAADRANVERGLATAKSVEPLVIARDPKKSRAWPVQADGQPVSMSFRASYDAAALHLSFRVSGDDSPWKNGAKDWRLVFKGGDCLDFQLSPTGNRGRAPAEGDFRLLFAPFGDETAAVLLMPKSKDAAPYTFSSPVQSVVFQRVVRLNLKPTVVRAPNGVTVSADVPWELLGMSAPKAGTKLTGDVGFITSDAKGEINTARVYRSNKTTNLVNDQPGEAQFVPAAFSDVVFE